MTQALHPSHYSIIWDASNRHLLEVDDALLEATGLSKADIIGVPLDESLHVTGIQGHQSVQFGGEYIPHSIMQIPSADGGNILCHAFSHGADDPSRITTIFVPASIPPKDAVEKTFQNAPLLAAKLEPLMADEILEATEFYTLLARILQEILEADWISVRVETRRTTRGGTEAGLIQTVAQLGTPSPIDHAALSILLAGLCGDSRIGLGLAPAVLTGGGMLGFSFLTTTHRCVVLLRRSSNAWTTSDQSEIRGMLPLLQATLQSQMLRSAGAETLVQLEAVLRAMDEGAVLLRFTDGDSVVSYINDAFLNMFSIKRNATPGLPGRSLVELLRPTLEDPGAISSLLQIVADVSDEHILEITLAGEARKNLRVNSSAFRTPGGGVAFRVLLFEDLTHSKEIEHQLLHSQKMESIGTLAGGVAHDFNNLLTTMLGNAELLKRDLEHSETALAKLQQIEKSGRRAAELTTSLLAFSRRNPTILRVIRIGQVVEETLAILRSSIPAGIEIKLKLDAELPFVEADPTQLEQVLINLTLNARDAVPENGKIVIASYAARDPQNVGDMDAPMYAVLEVSDNGGGIASEDLHRVFEPFYTTKEVGKGTGLGLAMVYGIVKKHGGFIEVKSAPGMGSRFSVFLPVTQKEPMVELPAKDRRHGALARRNYTMLIVDDEADLREFSIATLREYCERIDAAENGLEAVRLFEKNPHAYDLVLLDLTMPKMGGADCYRRLRELNPAVRVLISSGYSLDDAGKSLISHGAIGFLPKPFSVKQLLNAVAKALKSIPNVKRSGPVTKPPIEAGGQASLHVGINP